MLLSAVSVLVVAQSSSEIPEGLMNNPVYKWFHKTCTRNYNEHVGLVSTYRPAVLISARTKLPHGIENVSVHSRPLALGTERIPLRKHESISSLYQYSSYIRNTLCSYSATYSLCQCPKINVTYHNHHRHNHHTLLSFFSSWTLTRILRRSRTGTVWFYTSTTNKRAARPKLYIKSLTRDLKRIISRNMLSWLELLISRYCCI